MLASMAPAARAQSPAPPPALPPPAPAPRVIPWSSLVLSGDAPAGRLAAPAEGAGPSLPPPPPASTRPLGPGAERFEAPLSFYVRERALADVLEDAARAAGLRLRVNDRLDGKTVQRQRFKGSVRQVFDELARQHNLSWFSERDLVDVSLADTATVKTYQIGRVPDGQIRDAVQRFGLVNADFSLEVDERNGIARVFAPPRLSSRLESIIVGLRAPVALADGPVEVIRFGQRAPATQ
jgi:hypothetical protein